MAFLTARDKLQLQERANNGSDIVAAIYMDFRRELDEIQRTLKLLLSQQAVPITSSSLSPFFAIGEDLSVQATGSNDTFVTSSGYVLNSLSVWVGGVLQTGDSLSYITQTDPVAGIFTTASNIPNGETVIVSFLRLL